MSETTLDLINRGKRPAGSVAGQKTPLAKLPKVGLGKLWPSRLSKLGKKTKVTMAVAAVALLALAGFLFWNNRAAATEYMTARVERGNLRNTVTATGTLQALTTIQVGSQASGTISALNADFNSHVKKGQVIAQLDPAVPQAQVLQSRANLENARASLQQARAAVAQSRAGTSDAQAKVLAAQSTTQNQQAGVSGSQANLAVLAAERDDALASLNQQKSLVEAGVIAQRDYQIAETAYKTAAARYNQAAAQLNQSVVGEQSARVAGQAQATAQLQQSQAQVQQSQAAVLAAQAQVEQAEAALRLAEVNLAHTTITSPIDGIVVSRDVNVGQTVAASLSAPTLFTIANDLTKMQVIANIDQADIGVVEQAKAANFSVDAFPGKDFNGTLREMRLNPVSVQNVVTYNVVIDVDNPEQKLKPGMTANLIITIDERNNVLKVPNAALRFTPQSEATGGGGQRQGGGGRTAGAGQNPNGQGAGAAGQNSGAQNPGTSQAVPANANNAAGSNTPGANGSQPSADQSGNQRERMAPATAPVLSGQTRRVWVLGKDGKPQARRVTVGLSDGSATEIVAGNLVEGELVVTGETLSSSAKTQTTGTQPAPGFGGAPRTGGGGGGRRP
jgi:HlyD family secretion protein